jgi:serine kinase of HPr protein (carbohydrate metabolism regulator)
MSLLHHATCVAIAGRAVLIEGPAGSGKSSLALALIDRGALLVGDDGITLQLSQDHANVPRLLASPPPNIAGLLEIRNVGLLQFETASDVPVALLLRLDRDAQRYIEVSETVELLGTAIPLVRLWPDSPALHLRAEAALKAHGLG